MQGYNRSITKRYYGGLQEPRCAGWTVRKEYCCVSCTRRAVSCAVNMDWTVCLFKGCLWKRFIFLFQLFTASVLANSNWLYIFEIMTASTFGALYSQVSFLDTVFPGLSVALSYIQPLTSGTSHLGARLLCMYGLVTFLLRYANSRIARIMEKHFSSSTLNLRSYKV